MLARLVGGGATPGVLQAGARAMGLGLAWLVLPAGAFLALGGPLDALAWWMVALEGALAVAYGAVLLRRRDEWMADGPPAGPPAAPASRVLAAAALLALARLLAVALRRPRFTAGSDEWILMRTVRYFLEARPIAATWDFDVWGLVMALLVRLARVDLVDAYRVYLPAVLIVAASLAFVALAEELFRDRTPALFAYLFLAVYALSDMQARGEGAGMALLVRIMEDKYVACLVAVPLAQAAFLALMRDGGSAAAWRAAVLSLAAVLVSPLSLVWLAVTVGPTCASGLVTGRLRLSRPALLALSLTAASATALAWWLRSQRHASFFELAAPGWPYSAVLRGLSHRQLWILSVEDGFYLADPALVRHPLVVAAVVGVLFLLPRFRRSLCAQFLVCATWVPLLLVFNPLTAPALGALITPWMVYRVLWMVPVALALGGVLHGALGALQRRLGARRGGALRPRPVATPCCGSWPSPPPASCSRTTTARSRRSLKLRNHVVVSQREKDLMHAVGRERLAGIVLAPREIAVRLPAWTSRLRPSPGLDEIRLQDSPRLRDWNAFYDAAAIGEAEVAVLRQRNIDYVITRAGTPLDEAIRRLPGPFKPRVRRAVVCAVRVAGGSVAARRP